MDNSIRFLYSGYIISIISLSIAGLITAMFVIPLQYRQSKVKNGLAALRRQMLLKGILALTVIVLAIFCLSGRFFINDPAILRYSITGMIIVFSLGILGKAIIDFQIYHQQYSDENKHRHEEIDKVERREEIASKIDKQKKK